MEKDESQLTELVNGLKKIYPELFNDPKVDKIEGEDIKNMDMNAIIRRVAGRPIGGLTAWKTEN